MLSSPCFLNWTGASHYRLKPVIAFSILDLVSFYMACCRSVYKVEKNVQIHFPNFAYLLAGSNYLGFIWLCNWAVFVRFLCVCLCVCNLETEIEICRRMSEMVPLANDCEEKVKFNRWSLSISLYAIYPISSLCQVSVCLSSSGEGPIVSDCLDAFFDCVQCDHK